MEITHWKKRSERELIRGIKHFMQIKLFYEQIGVQEIQLKLYWSVVRPIVVYGCEAGVFKKILFRDSQ
jgi:hypothetical protein